MVRIRQFAALARLTALETMRQPLVLLLTTTTVVLTAVVPMVLLHQFGDNSRVARDGGLAFQLVFGLLIAAFAASTSLSYDVRKGTAATVLSKPVGRTGFLLAKFTGIAFMTAYSLTATLATLLAQRVAEQWTVTRSGAADVIDWQTATLLLLAPVTAFAVAGLLNYGTRRPFGSSAFLLQIVALGLVLLVAGAFDRTGQRAAYDLRVQWNVVPAGALIALALLIFAAIAMALSTRLLLAPTLVVCLLVFAAGLLMDYMMGRVDPALRPLLDAAIPNWQHFWRVDQLANGGTIPAGYLARVVVYTTAYAGAVLALGAWSFESADI